MKKFLTFAVLVLAILCLGDPIYVLNIKSDPANQFQITIDGKTYKTPAKINVKSGATVKIEIPKMQEIDINKSVSGNDSLFAFLNWNDRNFDNPRKIYINNNLDFTLSFTPIAYKAQIDIFGESTEAWYQLDSKISYSIPEKLKSKFAYWDLNGKKVTDTFFEISVISPLKITAKQKSEDIVKQETKTDKTQQDIKKDTKSIPSELKTDNPQKTNITQQNTSKTEDFKKDTKSTEQPQKTENIKVQPDTIKIPTKDSTQVTIKDKTSPVQINTGMSVQWMKTYGGNGDESMESIEKYDDLFIGAGYTNSKTGTVRTKYGDFDLLLTIFDKSGKFGYSKVFGGSGKEWASSIKRTRDGGFIVCGTTNSNDEMLKGLRKKKKKDTYTDLWLLKLDKNANLAWSMCYGGAENDGGYYAEETSDGNFIVCGYTSSSEGDLTGWKNKSIFGSPSNDMWFLKVDKKGKILWSKPMGGSGNDVAYRIKETDDGFIALGITDSIDGDAKDKNKVGYDVWVVNFDKKGNVNWQNFYGGKGGDTASDIFITQDKGYIFTGKTFSDDLLNYKMNGDLWAVKLNSKGEKEWQKVFGGSGDDLGTVVIQNKEGNYIVAGWTYSGDGDVKGYQRNGDLWVLTLNTDGKITAQKCVNMNTLEWGKCLIETDNGYMFGGLSRTGKNDPNGADDDIIVVNIK